MRSLPCSFAAALLAPFAVAQCPFHTVTAQSYGQGCNPVFAGQIPTVAIALDATACSLDAAVGAFGGCCNTYLVGHLLVLGPQQVAVPLPGFGVGCTLLADPAIVLFAPAMVGGTFTLPLPTVALPPLTFFVQGAAFYFTTIGFDYDFALSAGGQVDVS